MSDAEKIAWVKKYTGEIPDAEALEMYEIYRSYRDEGQTHEVSCQYAGIPTGTGEY